jgi:hypothetical protein
MCYSVAKLVRTDINTVSGSGTLTSLQSGRELGGATHTHAHTHARTGHAEIGKM